MHEFPCTGPLVKGIKVRNDLTSDLEERIFGTKQSLRYMKRPFGCVVENQ